MIKHHRVYGMPGIKVGEKNLLLDTVGKLLSYKKETVMTIEDYRLAQSISTCCSLSLI